MCFKVLLTGKEDYEVLYDGLLFWTKKDEDTFEFFLRKIRNNGGMEKFEAKATALFDTITDETHNFMQQEGYGFDFYDRAGKLLPSNNDLFIVSKAEDSNVVIARLSNEEVEFFMSVQKKTLRERDEILQEVIYVKQDSPNAFNPGATESVFGVKVKISKRGLSPDYDSPTTAKYLYQGNRDYSRIKIKMSGNIDEDFRRAFAEAGIDTSDPALANYVWHHLDDMEFDDEGIATCTMQLIEKAFHKQFVVQSLKGLIDPTFDSLVVGRHIGSISIFEATYLVLYK